MPCVRVFVPGKLRWICRAVFIVEIQVWVVGRMWTERRERAERRKSGLDARKGHPGRRAWSLAGFGASHRNGFPSNVNSVRGRGFRNVDFHPAMPAVRELRKRTVSASKRGVPGHGVTAKACGLLRGFAESGEFHE